MEAGELLNRFLNLLDAIGLGWVWLLAFAAWGGTASYLARIRKSQVPFRVAELLGEWAISGFAGILAGYLCLAAGFDQYLTLAVAGVSGHMGGRFITLIEDLIAGEIRRRFGGGK
ncbi:phage holin family protein [Pseudomonas sp. RL]|uniref:phage holin family protein n=1 Tax=Pseudomonas sp. RL TaxID=1452718 RepID=UPI000689F90F|nr:phage holin family protein [Pseudomonas sp. RL]